MDLFIIAVMAVWLWLESRRRKATEDALAKDLAALRREVAMLKGAGKAVPPIESGTQPQPPSRPMDATAEVVVPPWIRALPEPPRPAPVNRTVPAPVPAMPKVVPPPPRPPAQSGPVEPSPAPSPASSPASIWRAFDWESLVGIRLFSYIAGIALLVAAVAFLRYSIDNGWLSPGVRLGIGLLTGTGLLVFCETRRAQVYAVTAQSLTAAGIATLFSSFYAATAMWHLLPSWLGFALMALVTAVAVALAIRREAVVIALLGLVGGFATPMLLSTGQDHPLGLFGYLALLNVGLAWVANRKRWPLLTALAVGFTVLYQLGWVLRFLNEATLGIGLGIFLLFPVLSFGAQLLARSKGDGGEAPPLARRATLFTALPPLLMAWHGAAAPEYSQHWAMMFGFLFLVASGLAAVALVQGPEWLHLLGAAGVLGTFATWMLCGYNPEAWPMLLGFLALFVGLYLGVPWLQARWSRLRPFEGPGLLAVKAAPLLLFVIPLLVFLEARTAAPGLLFGTLFALLLLTAAYAVRFQDGPAHLLGCCIALAAEVAWSRRFLEARTLLPALLIYGGFALFFLGVPWWAERRGKLLRPSGSGAILAFATLPILFFLTGGPVAGVSLMGLGGMVGLLNLGLLHEASRQRYPQLSVLGMLLGWVLLGVWCGQALVAANLAPVLLLLAAYGLLVLGGRFWLQNRTAAVAGPLDGFGLHLGLVGHLFLLGVVLQPGLAPSPWPWLAVLLVLDLALGLASLFLRKGDLLAGASVLTTAILVAWADTGAMEPSAAQLAPWAGLGFAFLGLGWAELAHRRGADFSWAAGLGFLGAQGIIWVLGPGAGGPAYALQVLLHALPGVGLLCLAWRSGRHAWSVALAISAGLVLWLGWGATLATARSAWDLLGLMLPLYGVQLAYPLALGRAARTERLPFLSALLASAVAFLLARPALMILGFGPYIGALPLLQALLLVPHLVRLLRLQPEGQRELGRLALVAGGILAFVTLAIPLQLDREWLTLGWALLGLALIWLHGRVPHPGLLTWAGGLFAVVFTRLALNPAVLEYHRRSEVPVLNWYLYTYLVAAACCFGAARLLKGRDDQLSWGLPRLSKPITGAGGILLFLLLNIEIADVFSIGPALTFNLRHGSLAQDLSYTIGWALFAILMLVAGIVARNRMTRVAAILLLTVTILKAFLHDLARLEGLFRVGSFVGLALSLALVAVILQKFALRRSEAPS